MHKHFHREFYIVIILLLCPIGFYEITFGVDHRLFEKSFGMPYPLTSEQKNNAKQKVLRDLLHKKREAVDLSNRIVAYRVAALNMPTNTPEEQMKREKQLKNCSILEYDYAAKYYADLYDSCHAAFTIGMMDELQKFDLIQVSR